MCVVNVKLIPIIQIRRANEIKKDTRRRHGVQKAARILHAFTSLRHSWSDSCVRDTIKRRKRIREKDRERERKREHGKKTRNRKKEKTESPRSDPAFRVLWGPAYGRFGTFSFRDISFFLSLSLFPSVNDQFMLISLSAAWKKKKARH